MPDFGGNNEMSANDLDFDHLRELPDGSLTRAEVAVLLDIIDRLHHERDVHHELSRCECKHYDR